MIHLRLRAASFGFLLAIVAPTAAFADDAVASTSAPAANDPASPLVAPPVGADKANVPASPPDPKAHMHHGLFIRFSLGPSYLSASWGDDRSASGGGMTYDAALGGTLTKNIVIYGGATRTMIFSPSVNLSGSSATADTLNFTTVGPGITYYVMPANFHVGGSLFVSTLSMEDGDKTFASTHAGYGATVRAGQDWWLADHGTLGVTAQFTLASMDDSVADQSRSVTVATASVALQVTLN